MAIVGCVAADNMRKKHVLPNATIVKIYLFLSHFIPACIMPCLMLVGCDATKVLWVVAVTMSFLGFAYISTTMTLLDVSPNFVGALYGMVHVPIAAASNIFNHLKIHQPKN